jgi:hypothetical protein
MPATKQAIFRNMLVGTLLYSVLIGFFNDYTDIMHTGTYSTTFMLAIVMQLLTFATFWVKDIVAKKIKALNRPRGKVILGFGVWFVIFLSIFVFLWAISFIFRDSVEISGFVGLLLVIVLMTALQKMVQLVDARLAK